MKRMKEWAGALLGVALLIVTGLLFDLATASVMLAIGAVATTRDLKTILGELKALQDEYTGKPMPQNVGEQFRDLAKEAQSLQDEADRARQIKAFEVFGREVPEVILPASKEQKSQLGDSEIAGYLTLGQATVMSPLYRQFVEANFPKGNIPLLVVEELKGIRGSRTGYVPLTRKQRAEWESKAVPTLGTGVLEPQRLSDIVQETAMDRTVLRDVLNVARTTASSVEYLREETATRAALTVAHGVGKPEAAMEITIQTATVRTIAVWLPVTVQMLSDFPALKNLIDNRLLYDLRKEEEEQVMYGEGSGTDFAGIIPNAGHDIATADARVTSPTLIDQVRVGMTEVLTSGYEPNALVIHPIDWEGIVLMKGDDLHYLAQVFPTQDGGSRIWGLDVVETVAAQASAGVATEARNMVVGDFRRGATLWIREEASVAVGLRNADFTTNTRTILAEERAAFAVHSPDAFAILETEASAT